MSHKLEINPCIKCGCEENTIAYVPDEHDTQKTFHEEEVIVTIKDNNYINVICSCCKYSWKIDALDKDNIITYLETKGG